MDLIERQAAIDAISCDITVTGRQNAELVAATIGTFADRIKALPSIQTDLQPTCNNLATDAISRQATIEAMEGVDWYHINENGQLTHGANSMKDEPLYKAEDVYKVLNDMPSAQSDSCNGCKWENAFGYGECDHCKRSYNDMYEVENGKTT